MKAITVIEALLLSPEFVHENRCQFATQYIGEEPQEFLHRIFYNANDGLAQNNLVQLVDGEMFRLSVCDYSYVYVYDSPLIDPRAGRNGYGLPSTHKVRIVKDNEQATIVYLYKLD